jgi:hypothetical protein
MAHNSCIETDHNDDNPDEEKKIQWLRVVGHTHTQQIALLTMHTFTIGKRIIPIGPCSLSKLHNEHANSDWEANEHVCGGMAHLSWL